MMHKKKHRKKSNSQNIFNTINALDLMLSGYDEVIGPDFIMGKNDPLNAEYGYLNPDALRRYDQEYIDTISKLKAQVKCSIPNTLEELSKNYLKQRELLSEFHNNLECIVRDNDIAAAKELGNYDEYGEAVVIRNTPEFNVFYDYILLYREVRGKRALADWVKNNKHVLTKENRFPISQLIQAKFSILRIDENLNHGAIIATDIASQEEVLLMDIALNKSKLQGQFFICSLLDMGQYVMTSGGGIPLDPNYSAGKSILTLSKEYLEDIKNGNVLTSKLIECVRKIYGTAIRGRALSNMTSNPL